MKKLQISLLTLLLFVPKFAQAEQLPNTIVISNVLLGTSQNSSDEIVTIYNNTDSIQDISGYKVQYKSAVGTTWSTRATVDAGTVLGPYEQLSAASVQTGELKLSAGLSQTGGNLRIVDSVDGEFDRLAWGSGNSPLGDVAPAPQADERLVRKPRTNSFELQNLQNNKLDFVVENEGTTEEDTNTSTDNQTQQQTEVTYLPLQLSELFPDPVSPKSDSNDEYIEIYNPNNTVIDLNLWQLRDGGGKTYTFSNIQLSPQSFGVFYSKDTHISLNNSGDSIILVNPAGDEIDETPNYDSARAGLSWGLSEDGWAWMNPTPSQKNSSPIVISESTKSNSTKSTSKKKAKSNKASAKKAKASAAKSAAQGLEGDNEDTAATKNIYSVWSWLLIAAGVGTIGYGIYEYRPEIKSYYFKLRDKLSRRL